MIEIPLKGATRGTCALIDDADMPIIERFRWRQHSAGYAVAKVRRDRKQHAVLMHRLILDAPPLLEVDHVNGNRLDNRRANLRLATRLQNARNRKQNVVMVSRFKGVRRDLRRHCWTAAIKVDRRSIYLGSFAQELDAALAYDRAAKEHFGAFARVNFPMLHTA